MRIDDIELTVRVRNSLKAHGVTEVAELVRMTPRELKRVPNIGVTSLGEVQAELAKHGLRLGMAGAEVATSINAEFVRVAADIQAFVDALVQLQSGGMGDIATLPAMAPEALAELGLDADAVQALDNGLRKWGLQFGMPLPERAPQPADDAEDDSVVSAPEVIRCLDATTVADELPHMVSELLEDAQPNRLLCFAAYYGIDGSRTMTLQQIANGSVRFGFDRVVTRERVRQILLQAVRILRRNAWRAEFRHWALAVREARRVVPMTAAAFVAAFGYEVAPNAEKTYRMLRMCAGIFRLEFPFEALSVSGFDTLIVPRSVKDRVVSLLDGLRAFATMPYAEVEAAAGHDEWRQSVLRRAMASSSKWELLDDAGRYFWKRPGLPPKNYGMTGNAILTSLCKVFSITRAAPVEELCRALARDRMLRKGSAPAARLPPAVLEGIARRSGLFDVGDGEIQRQAGRRWFTIGWRDAALLAASRQHGRLLPSHVLYASLMESGMSQESAGFTIAYSPFLVHTRPGSGNREGLYKFILDPADIDIESIAARVAKR